MSKTRLMNAYGICALCAHSLLPASGFENSASFEIFSEVLTVMNVWVAKYTNSFFFFLVGALQCWHGSLAFQSQSFATGTLVLSWKEMKWRLVDTWNLQGFDVLCFKESRTVDHGSMSWLVSQSILTCILWKPHLICNWFGILAWPAKHVKMPNKYSFVADPNV